LIVASSPAQTMPAPHLLAPLLKLQPIDSGSSFTTIDLPSLRGKAVVIEFWATWCVPCISEIPAINNLVARTDHSRVQFISISDEDPTIIRAFLKKHPIAGLIGIDTSSRVFTRYGVTARPATFVIGPDGRIVSNNIAPDKLSPGQLDELALGGRRSVGVVHDAAIRSKVEATEAAAMKDQLQDAGVTANLDALFSISVSSAKGGEGHAYFQGSGSYRLINMELASLLRFALSCSPDRIVLNEQVPKAPKYNLNVQAPNTSEVDLKKAVEVAIASATATRIDHHEAQEDVLFLSSMTGTPAESTKAETGLAAFNTKQNLAVLINANVDQIATLTEEILGHPVLVADAVERACTANIAVQQGNRDSFRKGLENECHLRLTPGTGQVDRIVVTPRLPLR
jgi:peroxiredoxin